MNEHRHTWFVIGIAITAIVLFAVGMFFFAPDGNQDLYDSIDADQSTREEADREELTQQVCEEAGGTWNACGSACRMDPDAVCIELCVAYCECERDDQCPAGLSCGDYVDEVGVCL